MRNTHEPTQPTRPGHVRAREQAPQQMTYDDPMTRTTPRRPGTPRTLMTQRQHWTNLIRTTPITCRRCHQPIHPGQKWELGHPPEKPYATGNRTEGLAPEHAHCNKTGIQLNQPATFNW